MPGIKPVNLNFIDGLTFNSYNYGYFALSKFSSLIKISLVEAGLFCKPAFVVRWPFQVPRNQSHFLRKIHLFV
jgi:hypothetical protein